MLGHLLRGGANLIGALYRALRVLTGWALTALYTRIDRRRAEYGKFPMSPRQRRRVRVVAGVAAVFVVAGCIGTTNAARRQEPPRPSPTYVQPAPRVEREPIPPTTAPTSAPSGAPHSVPELDVDIDAPRVNLPDGALTGGYCARKWWC